MAFAETTISESAFNESSFLENEEWDDDVAQDYRAPFDLTTFLIIVYLFWFFTTPYLSNRLAFLGDLKFERILAIALLGLTLAGGRINQLFSGISAFVGVLFGFMVFSFFLSSYPDYANSVHWADTYWKKVAFFVIVAAGLRQTQHLDRMLKGMVCVIVFYQLISWLDFLKGGSFVYQQGMKRMIGTWSGGGYGAANKFGLLCAFGLPFLCHWYKISGVRKTQLAIMAAAGMSIASIIFTGTRGALVVAFVYLVFTFRRSLLKPKRVVLIGLICVCLIPALPQEIKYRYWDLMISAVTSSEPQEDLNVNDQIAISSGRGRLTGMINGFQMGMRKPLFGYGPGTSPIANHEVLGFGDDHHFLQLHNIYGQIAAEVGLVGLAIWFLLIIASLAKLWILRRRFGPNSNGGSACSALIGGFFVLLSYGFFSHSFYDVKWLFLTGTVVALGSFTWDDFAYESTDTAELDEFDDEDFDDDEFDDDDEDFGDECLYATESWGAQ